MHGHVLQANTVLISPSLKVSLYFGDVGRWDYREDPGSGLSSDGESSRPHQKHTVVYPELIPFG